MQQSGNIVRKCVNCGNDVSCHASNVVASADIQKVLESVESIPSLIIPNLYLDGFISAMNIPFLKEKNIKHIVNTAWGLETQFPKYGQLKQTQYEPNGITCVCLDWVDSEEQEVDMEVLLEVVGGIQRSLLAGEAVLVHCAQVHSVYHTAACCYVLLFCSRIVFCLWPSSLS